LICRFEGGSSTFKPALSICTHPLKTPGQLAEDYVAEHLLQAGWQILARNLRTPLAEIDILALPPPLGSVLVVVEVKARHCLSYAQGEETLGRAQRRRLARALSLQASLRHWRGELRADLYCVELLHRKPVALQLFCDIELLDQF
jgi:putative endonuclease